jgi:hypothetical protein
VNDDLCTELGEVRDALNHVAASVSNLIPRGELDRVSTAVVEDNKRWRRSVVLLIIGGPVSFLTMLAILWQGHQSEISFRRDIRQGMTCLLGDISSHRRDQRAIEQALIKQYKLEVELGPETTVPKADLDEMVKTCGPVLSRFLGYSLSGTGHVGHEAEGGNR